MPHKKPPPRGSLLYFVEDFNGYLDLYYLYGHQLSDKEILEAIWDGPEGDGASRVKEGELPLDTFIAQHSILWKQEKYGRWGFCWEDERDTCSYCLHENAKPGRGAFAYTLVKLHKPNENAREL